MTRGIVVVACAFIAAALAACSGSEAAHESGGGTVIRVDPRSGSLGTRVHVDGNPCGLAVGEGAAWVVDLGTRPDGSPGSGGVVRIDPARPTQTRRIDVGERAPCEAAAGAGAVWVQTGTGSLLRVTPDATAF